MSSLLKSVTSSVLCLSSAVYGHSWLDCSDYNAEVTGNDDYDYGNCGGYIRSWANWGSSGFGDDRGINYQTSGAPWCQTTASTIDALYSDTYPYATYYEGDEITLVWPAKNHANYECFSNIPDSSMKLFYYATPYTSTSETMTDPTDLYSTSGWELLYDFQTDVSGCTSGQGADGCGFQNCVDFCDNTDRATCFGEITIDSADFPSGSGYYSFMWYWIFNGGDAAYTTCFEAYVDLDNDNPGTTGGDTSSDTDTDTNTDTSTNTDTDSETTDTETFTYDSEDATLDYIVQVPICYSTSNYAKATVESGANSAFDSSSDIDWGVLTSSLSQGTDSFNVTLQTDTDYPGTATSGSYDYGDESSDLCDGIEAALNDGGECEVCSPGDMRIYALSSGSSSDATANHSKNSKIFGVIVGCIMTAIKLFY